MARTAMYAVTDISTREVGIFTQLGSRDKGTLCVQNAFNSTFGRKAVVLDWGCHLFEAAGGGAWCFRPWQGSAIVDANGKKYLVEKVNHQDKRFAACAIVKEYNRFFGRKAVQSIASHQPGSPTYTSLHRAEVKTLFDSFSVSYAGPMLSTIFSAKAAKR